jgi:hypothetical protein
LDHDPVRRLLSLDLLEPRHLPARDLGDPKCERRRVVSLGDAVLFDVAVESASAAARSLGTPGSCPNLTTRGVLGVIAARAQVVRAISTLSPLPRPPTRHAYVS